MRKVEKILSSLGTAIIVHGATTLVGLLAVVAGTSIVWLCVNTGASEFVRTLFEGLIFFAGLWFSGFIIRVFLDSVFDFDPISKWGNTWRLLVRDALSDSDKDKE